MTDTIYTLISYIPGEQGYKNRWGDFEQGKDSELRVNYYLDKKIIGEAIAQAQFNDSDIEVTVLINGKNPDEYHDFISKEDQDNLTKELNEINDIAYEKNQELMANHKKKMEEERLKKIENEKLKKKEQEKKIEAEERAQLAKLTAKYNKQ